MEDGPTLGVTVLGSSFEEMPPRRQAWYARNLGFLRTAYRDRGSDLLVRRGDPTKVLPQLVEELGGLSVHVTRDSDPHLRDEREAVSAHLPVILYDHPGNHVQPPGTLRNQDGEGYRNFTPYSRRWLERKLPRSHPAPDEVPATEHGADPGPIPEVETDLDLPDPGENAARVQLDRFLDEDVLSYHEARERFHGEGTSHLGPYLALGVVSPRLCVERALLVGGAGARAWVDQLIRRDFHHDLLHREPRIVQDPLARRWKGFPWRADPQELDAWRMGETGIPLVDAALRELRETGWTSGPARRVAATVLTRHLLHPWTEGADAFRALALDHELALNVGGWQTAACLGIDEPTLTDVPDPTTPATWTDADAAWLERWVPESEGDPTKLQDPLVAPDAGRDRYVAELEEAGLA